MAATTLEPPLGCGAYRIKEFVAGRTIVFERVKDYWGNDLNVNVGRDNFDEMRYEYFRDATVALEAFKGDALDWRTENSAKNWATAYDFPAVNDKRVVLEEFPIRASGVMQGFVLNTRRDKFQDPRRAARAELCVRLRGDEQADVLRAVQAHRQLFRGNGACLARACPRARNSRSSRPCATRSRPRFSPSRYTNPVGGSPGERARQSARGDAAVEGSGLRDPQPQARQRQDRRAVHDRVSRSSRSEFRALRAVLQAVARTARHHGRRAHRRRGAVRKSRAQLGLRHHHQRVGPVALARQRAARLLGLGRPPISVGSRNSSASRTRRSTR